MEKLISRGAEADIYLGKWGPLDAVYKVRIRKPYMNEVLDSFLRRTRTLREAKMLRTARAYIPTPHVLYVGPKSYVLVLEYISGRVMKDELNSNPSLAFYMGVYLARLHSNGIAHGDPNTSNMILGASGKYYMIDFGLSYFTERIEDYAVDVHLFREILNVQHTEVYDEALRSFYEGYFSESKIEKNRMLDKLDEIEKRGRYSRRRSFQF